MSQKLEVYFGVPGAGKTWWLAKRVEELQALGLKDVKVVSLTNATERAFKKKAEKFKLGLRSDDIRTLHSFVFQGLKERGYTFWRDVAKWFRKRGFKYETEEAGEDWRVAESIGVALHGLFDLLRLTWNGQTEFKRHCEEFLSKHKEEMLQCGVLPQRFLRLFEDFMNHQLQEKKLDFTSMLFLAVREGVELEGGDVLVIDEAQDFGALHWAILKRWMEKFRRVLVAGDDDQAIYTFAGADPSYLLELAEKGTTRVLNKSWRVPSEVARLSNALISLNERRYPKVIEPRVEGGRAFGILLEDLGKLGRWNGKKGVLILTRTRKRALELSGQLRFVPHRLEIEGKKEVPKRLKLLWLWRQGKNLTDDEWFKVLQDVGLFQVLKKRLQERDKRDALVRMLLEGGAYELADFFGFPLYELQKWLEMLENSEAWENSTIRITTIHQAKGDEADYVIIDTAITPRILRAMQEDEEAERRVWYVALTRAREGVGRLIVPSRLVYPLKEEVELALARK